MHTYGTVFVSSVAESHNFYATPALGESFDTALAPTLLYRRSKFLKGIKVNLRSDIFFLLILCNENCCKYA
jgi:hypothetical protein